MRRTILVLTIIFCVPTAVMALTAWRPMVGNSELGAAGAAIQQGQSLPTASSEVATKASWEEM